MSLRSDYAPKGVQLLVINANDVKAFPDDSFQKMKERAKEKSFNFPYLFDESQAVARAQSTSEQTLLGKLDFIPIGVYCFLLICCL